MVTDQYQTSLEDIINSIYGMLYLDQLNQVMVTSLSLFMDAYNQTLSDYLNAENPSDEITKRLRLLSGPVNDVLAKFPDDAQDQISYPAVEIIKKKLTEHGVSVEKPFTRALRSNIPNILPEEPDKVQINGFSYAIIVVILTMILGVILGALLNFIK